MREAPRIPLIHVIDYSKEFMSNSHFWSRDSLWAKSVVFAERFLDEKHPDELRGTWAALALELLMRSAVAYKSPTLLAKDSGGILFALGINTGKSNDQSLGAAEVANVLVDIYSDFDKDDAIFCKSIMNRRNQELHTGEDAFARFHTSTWLHDYYATCKKLCVAQQKTLADYLGAEEAESAEELLTEKLDELKNRVLSRIAAHKKVFNDFTKEERENHFEDSCITREVLAGSGHIVRCPACDCYSIVKGIEFGETDVRATEESIEIRRSVRPNEFRCNECNLKLRGYPELYAASLNATYISTRTMSPIDYFGLDETEPDYEEAASLYNNE